MAEATRRLLSISIRNLCHASKKLPQMMTGFLLHHLISNSHTTLPLELESGQGTIDDYLIDVASLFEDPTPTYPFSSNPKSPVNHPASAMTLSVDRLPPSPTHTQSQLGYTISTYESPYTCDHPRGLPSEFYDSYTSSVRPEGITSQSGHGSVKPRSTSRKRAQGASWEFTLPIRNKSPCQRLMTEKTNAGNENPTADPPALNFQQLLNIQAAYETGQRQSSSDETASGPGSMPFINPRDLCPTHSHEDLHSHSFPQDGMQILPYTTFAAAEGSASSSLMTPMRSLHLLPSSNNPAFFEEPGSDVLPPLPVAGPYPRRPSNHASFLQYYYQD